MGVVGFQIPGFPEQRVLKGLRDVNAVVNHLGENSDFVIRRQAGLVCPTLGR